MVSRLANAFASWRIGAEFLSNSQVRPGCKTACVYVDLVLVVALSADAQESTKQLCLSSGMNGFFTKPMKKGGSNIVSAIITIEGNARGPIDPAHELQAPVNETRTGRPRPNDSVDIMTTYPILCELRTVIPRIASSTHSYCSASIQCTLHV